MLRRTGLQASSNLFRAAMMWSTQCGEARWPAGPCGSFPQRSWGSPWTSRCGPRDTQQRKYRSNCPSQQPDAVSENRLCTARNRIGQQARPRDRRPPRKKFGVTFRALGEYTWQDRRHLQILRPSLSTFPDRAVDLLNAIREFTYKQTQRKEIPPRRHKIFWIPDFRHLVSASVTDSFLMFVHVKCIWVSRQNCCWKLALLPRLFSACRHLKENSL